MNSKIKLISLGGIIAALYVALTLVSSVIGLSSGFIQMRFSEALCVLPIFTPAAIPGLFVGCFLANLLTGAAIYDVIFGSLATLAAAICTYLLRRHHFIAAIPPVIINALVLPLVFIAMYEFPQSYFYYATSIFISEVLMVMCLGSLVITAVDKSLKKMM